MYTRRTELARMLPPMRRVAASAMRRVAASAAGGAREDMAGAEELQAHGALFLYMLVWEESCLGETSTWAPRPPCARPQTCSRHVRRGADEC